MSWTFSATDRVTLCPASAALPQARAAAASDSAAWGTGVHQYLRDCAVVGVEAARRGLPKKAPWRACCLALDPSGLWPAGEQTAEMTVAYDVQSGDARDYGTDLGRAYPDLGPSWLVGTLDLVVTGNHLRVYDYKTGHHPPRAFESGQLMLAAVAMAALTSADTVTVGIVHVREDGSHHVDEYTYEPWDLDDAREQVRTAWQRVQTAKRVVARGEVPHVTHGDHCRYCPAVHACPAQVGLARSLVTERLTPGSMIETLTSEDAGRAYEQLGRAEALLEEIRRALHTRIAAEPGGLVLPDGSVVRAVEVTRESVDAERALPVLVEAWGAEHAQAVTRTAMSKGDIERKARELGHDPDAVLGLLRSHGAVPSTTTTSYRKTKSKKDKAA